jgi:hypothetical protein
MWNLMAIYLTSPPEVVRIEAVLAINRSPPSLLDRTVEMRTLKSNPDDAAFLSEYALLFKAIATKISLSIKGAADGKVGGNQWHLGQV